MDTEFGMYEKNKSRLSNAVLNYPHKGRRDLGRSRKRWSSRSLPEQASSLTLDVLLLSRAL